MEVALASFGCRAPFSALPGLNVSSFVVSTGPVGSARAD